MPWNNSGMASGAASGASAGATFGPWGAAIGGVAGGVLGGLSGGDSKKAEPPVLPATRYPGAVSNPYGSLIYDPITGGTRFVQNQSQGSYSPTSFQDAALYDELMGGSGATSGLSNQIQQQELMLEQLRSRGGGKAPSYEEFNIPIDPATGEPVNYQHYINKRGADNPMWDMFMKETGGNYGSDNPDISFGKWAKDYTNRVMNPAIQSYKNAMKAYESNSAAVSDAIQSQELQLQQLKSLAGDPGSARSSLSENPLLAALRRQEEEADSPSYLRAMNAQTQEDYDNQLRAQEQALASRGMGGSGLAEMTRARMGLQLGNALNQNSLAANQMTTDKRQLALNNRMSMLNFLSGRKDAAFNQGMAKEGLGLQMSGMGADYGMKNMGIATDRDIAQTGIKAQYDLANMNQDSINRMSENANWASALGSIGGAIGRWGGSSGDSTYSFTDAPIDEDAYQPLVLKPRESY